MHSIFLFDQGFYTVFGFNILMDMFGKAYMSEMTGFFMTVAGVAFFTSNALTGKG